MSGGAYETLTRQQIVDYLGGVTAPFQIRRKSDGGIYAVLGFFRNPFNSQYELMLFVEKPDGISTFDLSIFDAVKDYEIVEDTP